MFLCADGRLWAGLVLVAANHLKLLNATQDSNSIKEILQHLPAVQVGRFSRDDPAELALAPSGTTLGSQSHNFLSLTTQKCTRKSLIRSAWRNSQTGSSAPTPRLPQERKLHIHRHLEANRETIMAMKMEYKSLLESIKQLEKHMSRQVRRRCVVTGSRSVSSIFRKLKKFYKQHVLKLVQNHIYELGGIGSKMSIIEPGSHSKKAWGFNLNENIRQGLPFGLPILGRLKQVTSDEDVPKKLPSTQEMGSSPEKAEPHQDNLGESSNLVDLEYNPLAVHDLSPSTYITGKEKNRSTKLPSRLSGEHLRLVMEKVEIGFLKDLRKILHSITIEPKRWYRAYEWELEELLPFIRVNFEKCGGFQVLAYLYKFELITKVEVNSFFESKDTLELTARHLVELFPDSNQPLSACHSLLPDIDFIATNWRTEHLRYLKELDQEKQGYLVYRILKQACEDCLITIARAPETNHHLVEVLAYFIKENLLQEMRNWSPKPWDSISKQHQEDPMRENLEAVISLFKMFPSSTDGQAPLRISQSRISFLVNYHILKFYRKYGNENIGEFIKACASGDRYSQIMINIYGQVNHEESLIIQPKYNNFNKTFELISLGLEIQMLTSHSDDFSYFLSFPDNLINMIPRWITHTSHEELKKQIQQVVQKYGFISNQIQKESETDERLKSWTGNIIVENILSIFNEIMMNKEPNMYYNTWIKNRRSHVNVEPKDEEGVSSLAFYLSQHYNVIDRYREWSQEVYKKFYQGLKLKVLGHGSKLPS